jgi:hypothetical protein
MSFDDLFGGDDNKVELPVVYGAFSCQFPGCDYESEEAEYHADKQLLVWSHDGHGESSCKFSM